MMAADVADLDECPPEVRRQWQERRELFRIAAQRVVDIAGTGSPVDAYALAWARQVVRNIKPLQGPLSDGVLRCCYCGMEGHLSKDCPQPRNEGASA
jgi:hypothetical protein